MTDLLTTDHADSGEILPWDTVVLDATDIQPTRRLNPPTFRRPYATGERPIYRPATIGIVPGAAGLADVETETRLVVPADLLPPGQPRPPSPLPAPPPKPARHALTEVEPVRPLWYRGRARAGHPPWAWALIGAGTFALSQAVAVLIVLAVAW